MEPLEIKVLCSKTGLETMEVNGYLLHSKYDPLKEAKRIAEKEVDEQFLHILYGYGKGYLAEAIYNKLEDKQKLVVFDPIINLYNGIQQDSKFNIESDYEIFEKKLDNLCAKFDRKVKIILSPNFDKFKKNTYRRILGMVKDVQYESLVNEKTIRFFSEIWQENYIHNLLSTFEGPSLYELRKKYSCPIVIASGGPSLTKQLPLLKKMRTNIILIASGSTINSLLAADIEPDYIVSIDGGEPNFNHFQSLKLKRAKLIYALSNNYKIQEQFPNTKYSFIYSNEEKVKEHIKNILYKGLPMISGGGTVAVSALHIASFITSGPIALIGQDLAYTEKKSHAENNKHFKKLDETFFEERGAFEIEGYDGNLVLTDYVFNSMRKNLESLNSLLKQDSEIYNCTEGGVKIRGMCQIPFEDFFNNYINGDKVVQLIDHPQNNVNYNVFIESLEKEINRYKEIKKTIKDAIKTLDLNSSNKEFSPYILKKLNKIDERLKVLYDRVLMERIVEPISIDIIRNYQAKKDESTIESYKRVYNQNMELYKRLLYATKQSEKYTLKVLEKAKNKINYREDGFNGRIINRNN